MRYTSSISIEISVFIIGLVIEFGSFDLLFIFPPIVFGVQRTLNERKIVNRATEVSIETMLDMKN